MKKFLIIIFLLSTLAAAQNYKFGFDFGIHQIRTANSHILRSNADVFSLHLRAVYNFSDFVSARVQAGRSIHEEFSGWEFGLNCGYNFLHPLYLTAGIFLHLNEETQLGLTDRADDAKLFMYTMGLGVDINPVFSIDLNYFIPSSHLVIGHGVSSGYDLSYYQDKFYSMIRLSFNLAWEL